MLTVAKAGGTMEAKGVLPTAGFSMTPTSFIP